MASVYQPFFNKLLFIFLVFTVLTFGQPKTTQAACRGEGFLGITSKDPIMSWVDLTFSPIYTSASTSGTSGCKNWDFAKYLDHARIKFLMVSHQQVLMETVQGGGSHLNALTLLMDCSEPSQPEFSQMLWGHRKQTIAIFQNSNQAPEFLTTLRKWIKKDPDLSLTCKIS